jgi:hypothetical protein
VLGRSLDELAPQTRKLLGFLSAMVGEKCVRLKFEQPECFFTQREAREFTGWSDAQVKRHLQKLVEMEYVLTHRGGRGQSFVYELLYRGEGESGKAFMMGLIDIVTLCAGDGNRDGPNLNRDGQKEEWDPPGTPRIPPVHGPGTTLPIASKASVDAAPSPSQRETAEKTLLGTSGGDDTLAFPKPEKQPRKYALRRVAGDNGRDVLVRRVLYRRWNRKRAE